VPYELRVRFHSYFANRAAGHNDAFAALRDGWWIVHERIHFVLLKLGSNSGDDVATRGHKAQSIVFALASPQRIIHVAVLSELT
jgi:hypothetical protein